MGLTVLGVGAKVGIVELGAELKQETGQRWLLSCH